MSDEPVKCAKCGVPGRIAEQWDDPGWSIYCATPDCFKPHNTIYDTRAAAIAAWNAQQTKGEMK